MKSISSATKKYLHISASAIALVVVGTAIAEVGEERSSYLRLEEGEEHRLSLRQLLDRGERLFTAEWTPIEGGGRPLTKGTGAPLSDTLEPLVFPRNFNRVSARDANSCAGCHNAPFGIAGGGGDFVTGVFVAAQRFDFASFDQADFIPGKGGMNELGETVTLQQVGNFRATLGMFGAGYVEMLARQMTAELQTIRDSVDPGQALPLETKGVSFGTIGRSGNGSWDTSAVEGLPPQSLRTTGAGDPPSLVIHPFHQSGSVVSIREFTNNAFNHHHGMQSVERFGSFNDADGDGVVNELTQADITAASIFQATLPVPEVVMPRSKEARRAVYRGSDLFEDIGCAACHVPALPLVDDGWIYTEPNPYNPPGNLQSGDAKTFSIDLADEQLPGRRLKPQKGVVWVPAFTDLKLHDITSGEGDPNRELIDINHAGGSPEFFGGNGRFLTKKLWGAANERPYFHHGLFTTLREATLAHAGEAIQSRQAFAALPDRQQDDIIEFLKSLQVVRPQGAGHRIRH